MDDILKIKLQKPKPEKAKVKDVEIKTINNTDKLDGNPSKIVFYVQRDDDDNVLRMEEAWIQRGRSKVVKSLWIDPNRSFVPKLSNFGRVMDYYQKSDIGDFIDSEIEIFPDYKNYYVIAACPIDASVFNKIDKENLY